MWCYDGSNNRAEVFKILTVINWVNIRTLFEVANVDCGYDVSIYDRYIIVGAPLEASNSFTSSGKVYVEREESTEDWNLMSQVISSGVSGADMFGYSVSVCKDYAVVGAPNEDGNGFNITHYDGDPVLHQIKKGLQEIWNIK